MAYRIPTRADDEMHLEWLDRRHRGEGSGSIARDWGTTNTVIRTTTNRIRNADEATEGGYLLGYW